MSASLGASEALASLRSGSLESTSSPATQRQLLVGEVDRDQVASLAARPGQDAGAGVDELLGAGDQRGRLARSRASAIVRFRVESGSSSWGRAERRRVVDERQPRLAGREAVAGASGVHGIGARSGSRPSTSTTRSGGIVASGRPSSSPW